MTNKADNSNAWPDPKVWTDLTADVLVPSAYVQECLREQTEKMRLFSAGDETVMAFYGRGPNAQLLHAACRSPEGTWICCCRTPPPCVPVAFLQVRDAIQPFIRRGS